MEKAWTCFSPTDGLWKIGVPEWCMVNKSQCWCLNRLLCQQQLSPARQAEDSNYSKIYDLQLLLADLLLAMARPLMKQA